MQRRHFLKRSAFLSIGGWLAPGALLSSCEDETLLADVGYKGKVLIIGAGAAGLYAAYILQSKGIAVELLEASANYGGRLGKLEGFANFPIDLGAQWLHGRNNILGDLVKKTKTKVTLDESEAKYWFNNQLVDDLPQDADIFEGEDLPDVTFAEYAAQNGLGEDYKYIVENIAGDQGAAAGKLSVYYNNLEEENWNSGSNDFKFEDTCFDLIDRHVADYVKDNIRLNTIVRTIDYSGAEIAVTDSQGNTYLASKVIVTVPMTILKAGDIQFTPALPAEKTAAFSKIGMGAGMKVFLRFSEKFFDEGIVGGPICAAYADDSVGKVQDDNVLLAFVMGDQAEYLTALGSDAAITDALLQELDTMYDGRATATFLAAHVQNWTNHPFIRGAYSYGTVGMGNAREVAAQPLGQSIYFAGEAMNLNGHHQTLHGAVESGYRSVIQLLNDVKP